MALEFAYSNGSSSITPVREYPAATGYSPAKGDIVKLVNGEAVKAAATDATVLGVCEGPNFTGFKIEGIPTPTVSLYNPGTLAHVRTSAAAIYRIPLKAGATAPVVGTSYGMTLVAGDAQLDTANTTTAAIYKVDKYDAANKIAFVKITSLTFN